MVFYPKNKKNNPFWKLTGFFLLVGGASSPVNLTEVVVKSNVTIRYFMASDVVFEFSDIDFISNEKNEIVAIADKFNRFDISLLEEPQQFIDAIRKVKSEN
jgi:hypothetical protein